MANVLVDAFSSTDVPKACMALVRDLDHMGNSLFYAGVAPEETQLLV
jgi:hypothetical protein